MDLCTKGRILALLAESSMASEAGRADDALAYLNEALRLTRIYG